MSEINPIPSHDETARLAEVRRYAILDTPPMARSTGTGLQSAFPGSHRDRLGG